MDEVICNCGWKGIEEDLEMDFYESETSMMPLATICPSCKNEV